MPLLPLRGPMRILVLLLLASLALAPTVAAEEGVHKCAGTDAAARACVDYDAINDFCVTASIQATTHEECVLFIGPPPF